MADDIRPAEPDNGPRMRRWEMQRWLVDNIIKANGMEWDQPRLGGLLAALGPEAGADIAQIRARVQKYADIAPAFEAAARRREGRAAAHEAAGEPIQARENYFMAANYWCSAQWPIHENNATNLFYNSRKARVFPEIRRPCRAQGRSRVDPAALAQRQGAAGLAAPAAGIRARAHSRRRVDPRHGRI